MIKCDNDCKRAKWIEYIASSGGYELHISINPNSDLDSTFLAFDHDKQEMIRVNGWLFDFYQLES